ncbi:nitrogenase cofactor biosynthesis protein NifB [Desulfurispira natronophila]|uniref:Nitrogen fixation protein NifB n=1 Tax=Desulfurispira natronophila TaxID=682562 RepID=A0A7W8DGQ1_9BACT|nr:nitrogenase cofactor biosynthesis protein NifB [Desulfurispira natronophila]MBB5021614.1 nitrogen fixation protein NifB [Desulfurispira natronophila]
MNTRCRKNQEERQNHQRLQERIANHPCYCAKAHGKYSRIHLPVAPRCNIQCNYCNRKYDCSNESRPGVTSQVITPQQALERVKLLRERVPNLSVVGIAGPGDGLANPEETLRTIELVREFDPELKLCLSTNGLMLAPFVDDLNGLGVEHITVTVNAVDAPIGEAIYPWVNLNGKRYTGLDAAAILWQRQQEGITRAVELDAIVKINTVFIPEVNATHIMDITRTVKELGVFIHNIVPLICKPEHGTAFGAMGLREPEEWEIDAVRNAGTAVMGHFSRIMKHCKQCRADAAGLLGEDIDLQTLTEQER